MMKEKTIVISKRSKTKHGEHLKEKKCNFPGCEKIYFGTGASRFCEMHREKKYRKIIDQSNNVRRSKKTLLKKKRENPNQLIKHSYWETQTVQMNCALEGCHNKFSVDIIQGVEVYPKFCKLHRNEYQRDLFSERLNRGLIHAQIM
jgi:hypothetical protein